MYLKYFLANKSAAMVEANKVHNFLNKANKTCKIDIVRLLLFVNRRKENYVTMIR